MTVGSPQHATRTRTTRRWRIGVLAGALVIATLSPVTAWAAPGTTPVITSPTDGDVISSSTVQVDATSSQPEVRFVMQSNGPTVAKIATTSSNVASAVFSTVGLDGAVTLSAFDCDAVGDCSVTGDSVDVTIDLPAPTLTAPKNNTVVGDTFTARAASSLGPVGFLVDGDLVAVAKTEPYAAKVSVAGKSEGAHNLRAIQCNATGKVCLGATGAAVRIIKDTRGPTWTSVSAKPKKFYPANDGYLDSTTLSARMGEDAADAKVVISAAGGKTVRTLDFGKQRRGKIAKEWNGRSANGNLVSPGRYTFWFWAKDEHGNTSTSAKRIITVSDKRLTRKSATKTVTALGSAYYNASGACGGVYRLNYPQARFDWPKGLGYYSRSKCNGSAKQDIAAAFHRIRLPKALRYGSISVDTYGAGAFRHPGPAVILYAKTDGTWGAARKLSSSLGWHAGPNVALSQYMYHGSFRWGFATIRGDWYDVKEFRVTYSYFVLR